MSELFFCEEYKPDNFFINIYDIGICTESQIKSQITAHFAVVHNAYTVKNSINSIDLHKIIVFVERNAFVEAWRTMNHKVQGF